MAAPACRSICSSGGKGAQAEVLPQLLTPQTVIDAAERAAGRKVQTAAKR